MESTGGRRLVASIESIGEAKEVSIAVGSHLGDRILTIKKAEF